MTKNINIKETIMDVTSDFNIKRFKFGNSNIERPTKIIDGKHITKILFDEEKRNFQNIIFETSKVVRNIDTVENIIHQSDDTLIRNHFSVKEWYTEYPTVLSLTFGFNPYKKYRSIESLSGYFDYYHSYSNTALFVPNIKIEKYDYTTEPAKKRKIMSVEEFIKFVEEAYQILDHKNSKPIFVPISLRFDMDEIKILAAEYVKREFFNIWIDFEGASTTTKTKRGKIRHLLRNIENLGRLNDIITYSTNIKREIISNPMEDRSPSSDVLAPVIGANLVGVNREPNRPFNRIDANLPLEEQRRLKEEQKKKSIEMKIHKARIFNPDSYYYFKVKSSNLDEIQRKKLMVSNRNIFVNSRLLDSEFNSQTEYFFGKGKHTIKNYIVDKPMIQQYHGGDLVDTLFKKETRTTMDWY